MRTLFNLVKSIVLNIFCSTCLPNFERYYYRTLCFYLGCKQSFSLLSELNIILKSWRKGIFSNFKFLLHDFFFHNNGIRCGFFRRLYEYLVVPFEPKFFTDLMFIRHQSAKIPFLCHFYGPEKPFVGSEPFNGYWILIKMRGLRSPKINRFTFRNYSWK